MCIQPTCKGDYVEVLYIATSLKSIEEKEFGLYYEIISMGYTFVEILIHIKSLSMFSVVLFRNTVSIIGYEML